MEKSTTMRMEISAQLTSNGNWAGVNGYMQHQASLGGGSKGLFVVDYNGNTHIENVYFNNTLKYTQDWTSAYSGAKNKVAVIGMGNAENTWWTNISANRYAHVGKWYYIKVYRSGTLVRDYVPCVRNSDGVAGLYDKVENKFYTNSGTGSFGSGAATGDAVEEYQRVEHLDFTGSQYINTGYIPNTNTKVETTFKTSTNSRWLFGSRTSTSATDIYAVYFNSATLLWYQIRTSGNAKSVDNYFNKISYLTTTRSEFILNGKTTSGFGTDALGSSTWPMYIGSVNTAGKADGTSGRHFVGELYSFKIWDGTTLVRDFVPVVRSRDGVAGLYDMVGHKFYANAGSGSFKAGGVISADKGMSNGATMHYIGKSQVVATCIEDIFKRHFDITMSDATYYFEANKTRTIEINEELPAGVVVKYTWKKSSGETGSGNSFKEVGTYHVTATIAGGYYATTTATATLTIVQPSLSGITFTDKIFVYDGTQKKIEITGTLIEGASVSYSIKGVNGESVDTGATNGTTQVGVYEVTATFGGNLAGNTLVAYLTILKATHRVSLSNKTVTYNGNSHTLSLPTLPSGMSVASSSVSGKEYDDNHNPTKPVSATQNGGMVTRTNAGNYTITVNFNGGRNYNDTSSSATLIIQAAKLTISFAKTNAYNGKGWEYDGTPHEVKATVSNGANVSISYSYSGTLSGSDNKFRDVGTYNLTATLNGGPNYFAASASVTFTITKANLSTTLNNETFVYNGSPWTYTLKNGIVGKGNDGTFKVERCSIVYSYTGREFTESDTTKPTGSEVSVNGNTATNAGWYSTKLVITAPLSSNNIQNYNTLTITGTNNFKITKAPSSFNVGEVWALSGTTFKNSFNFTANTSQTITYTSSDETKVKVQKNGGETEFLVTSTLVDRTSSKKASQVTITATCNNVASTSFVVNLIPFTYNSSTKSVTYTSSMPNKEGGVCFERKLLRNKINNGVIQGEREELLVDAIGSYALSSSYEYGTGAVVIEEGLKTISSSAFKNCKIKSVNNPSTLTAFGEYSFYGCTSLETVNIPEGIKTIPNRCFQNCSLLSPISFPSKLKTLGEQAFSGCTSITQITLPTTVTLIDDGCFSSCSSLTKININQLSITTLHWSCFSDCTSLNGVQIPTTVTTIENYCFNNCSSWSGALNLPSNLTSIGYNAFSNFKLLTGALTLPSKITYIGSGAFENCSGFTSLTFNCRITTIQYYTFKNCSSIANTVTIPSSVTSIGDSAFSGCKQIKRFNFQTDNAPSVGIDAFSTGYANVQIWIPKYDGYASYRDALNSKGFVDRKTGSGAIMHSNDYRNLNNSNGQYDYDLARYYDGRWRKVLFVQAKRKTKTYSSGYVKLLSVNGSYLVFKFESSGNSTSGATVKDIYYEILEGYSYKVEAKTGNLWGGPMASWLNRDITLWQMYASSSTSFHFAGWGKKIKEGNNYYGNVDATSYCDIKPEDYGLLGFDINASST